MPLEHIPTPYDAEIEKHMDSPYEFIQRTHGLWEAKAEGYRRGWADATALYAPLLEAAKRLLQWHREQFGMVMEGDDPTATIVSRLLTVAQAARRLNLRQETIRAYILTGRLPARTLPGGYYRIEASDLERILQPVEKSEQR